LPACVKLETSHRRNDRQVAKGSDSSSIRLCFFFAAGQQKCFGRRDPDCAAELSFVRSIRTILSNRMGRPWAHDGRKILRPRLAQPSSSRPFPKACAQLSAVRLYWPTHSIELAGRNSPIPTLSMQLRDSRRFRRATCGRSLHALRPRSRALSWVRPMLQVDEPARFVGCAIRYEVGGPGPTARFAPARVESTA
jgi:hypothetical protein